MVGFPFTQGGPDLTQVVNSLQNIQNSIANLQQTVFKIFPLGLTSSASWNPGSISTLSQTTIGVTCAGAVLGMSAQAAFSLDLQGLTLTAYVQAPNNVQAILFNGTAGGVSISTGTISVWVRSN